MSNTDKLTSTMSIPTLLNMDPLTFTLTVLSLAGLFFSAINFLRHFTPTNLYVHAANLIAQTRSLYDSLERDDLLPGKKEKRRHLDAGMELLEDKIKPLMFVIMPTRNIFRILRAWTKVWALLEISQEVERFRVGIQSLSDQRKRINRLLAQGEREGVPANLQLLETDAEATTEMFISSLGVHHTSHSVKDVERIGIRSTASDCPASRRSAVSREVHASPERSSSDPPNEVGGCFCIPSVPRASPSKSNSSTPLSGPLCASNSHSSGGGHLELVNSIPYQDTGHRGMCGFYQTPIVPPKLYLVPSHLDRGVLNLPNLA